MKKKVESIDTICGVSILSSNNAKKQKNSLLDNESLESPENIEDCTIDKNDDGKNDEGKKVLDEKPKGLNRMTLS